MLHAGAARFGVTKRYDYRGVPPYYEGHIRELRAGKFVACVRCAAFIRLKDQQGLEDFVAGQYDGFADLATRPDRYELLNHRVSAQLARLVFWLGLAKELGDIVPLFKVLPPAWQTVFSLLSIGVPNAANPRFRNGTELYVLPVGEERITIEGFTSISRGLGHASKTLRFAIAAADRHGAILHGLVEPHTVAGVAPGRTKDELLAWYGHLGFVRDPAHGVDAVVRYPDLAISLSDRETALSAAAADVVRDSL